MITLDADRLRRADAALARRDPLMARLRGLGRPRLWARRPGFGTLVRIILEQQVSLASADRAFERLRTAAKPLTPGTLLALDDAALRRVGFSRQKAAYARGLADTLRRRRIDLSALARRPDEEVRRHLMAIRGIGRWTADVYLLMALRRADVWPRGDLALDRAVARLHGPERARDAESIERVADAWRPYRAVAARRLWQFYLAGFRLPGETAGSDAAG